ILAVGVSRSTPERDKIHQERQPTTGKAARVPRGSRRRGLPPAPPRAIGSALRAVRGTGSAPPAPRPWPCGSPAPDTASRLLRRSARTGALTAELFGVRGFL